jgi:hypothetical protein
MSLGITLNDSSLGISFGMKADKFISEIGSKIISGINQGILAVKDLIARMGQGLGAIIESIKKGNFFDLLKDLFKENPGAAVAGATAVILIGGAAVAAVSTGVAAIAGAIAGAGFLTKAAILAVVVPSAIQAAQRIDNFDWQKSDAAIEAELQSQLINLYSVAGEAVGRSLAGLIVGRGQRAAVQINMKATATFFLILEEQNKTELQEEVLQALVSLAWAGARFIGQVALAKSYIQVRKWARQNVRTGIASIDKAIASWGLEENKSWSIASAREKAIEAVQEQNQALGNFLESFVEGFGEGLSEFLVMEYSR